ncbi:unnamed protein product [Effrenium voratum]|nr:unnamed protein product [Effrenium voratum]
MDGADPGASSGSPPPGCRGAGAIAAAAGLATLVLLGTALAFGATHRVEAGQELIFSNLRLSNTSNASNGTAALVMDLQGGQMVVLQNGAFTKQDANLSALLAEGQLARVRLSSREVLLNFSFTAEGKPAIMDRFFFTIYFMARQRVQLANFSRFCWDLASSFEHSGHGLAKNKVVLEAAPDLKRFVPKDPRGIPEMQRAATFLLRSVDHFVVSVITEGDADGSDFYFSGQNVVSDICEEASSKRIHDGAMVEIVEGPYNGLRGIADINSGRFQVLLANGKHVQVGEMDCRLLEEDREAVDAELQAEQVEDKCATLYDAERACSEDGCEVLLIPQPALSCDKYCQAHGMHCHQAWRSKANSCGSREPLQCLAALPQNLRSEHQLRCRCQPAARSRLGQEVQADAHVMLLSGGAGVAIKAPDAEGAVQVQVPAVVTLHAPLFRKVEGKGKSRSVPCEELRQGDEVELTDGAFAHRKGALLRCDPVSKQYSVSLEKSLQVHAFDLQVLQCKASEQGASCSEDHCKVQPSKKESSSCADFCKQRGDRCLRAWEGSGCRQQRLLPCEHSGDVTGMICECVPVSHPGDCFQNDLSYRPVNMKLQRRSKERSALSCQRRCARVAGCSHFSYWSDGGCHLQDDDAQLSAEPGAVSGPPDCLTEQKTSTDSACREGLSFRPLDMHGHARSHEASAAQCALRCKSVEGCSHFSYWSDGGCHLQDSRAVNGPSHGAFSGPPNCPELATAEAKEKESHQKLDKPESCNLVDVERYCPAASGCKALVSQMGHRQET